MHNWQTHTLGALGQTYSGLSGKSATDFGAGSPYISYMNIFSNSKVKTDITDLVQVNANEHQQTARYGDIFFTTSSETAHEVGTASVLLDDIQAPLYLNSFCFGYRMHDFNTLTPEYARFYFRSKAFQRKMTRIAQGASRYNLSKKQFNDTVITFPNVDSQKKSVAILETWERSIKELTAKITHHEQLHKALMQQLFTGKRRLEGFSGEWKTYKLSELVTIKTGKKDVNQGNPKGQYPFFTCSRNHTYSDSYSFDTEAILIAGNGDVGHCKYYNGKFEAYQRTYVLSNFHKVNAAYIYPYLNHFFQRFVDNQKQMGAMPYIKLGMLSNFSVEVPENSFEEDAISHVISNSKDILSELKLKRSKMLSQKMYLLNLLTIHGLESENV